MHSDGAAAVSAAGGQVLVQDRADALNPAMPRATLGRVPDAGIWPAAKLGRVVAEHVATRAPSARAPEFRSSCVEGLDEALWLALSRLQAHAAVQQRLEQQLDPSGPVAAQVRASADRALRAADLISCHVLPVFQGEPTDSGDEATMGQPR